MTYRYSVRIDGCWRKQTKMFSRADMAFWGFAATDVRPPADMVLSFARPDREPSFIPADGGKARFAAMLEDAEWNDPDFRDEGEY